MKKILYGLLMVMILFSPVKSMENDNTFGTDIPFFCSSLAMIKASMKIDTSTKLAYLQNAAEKGDVEAKFELGARHFLKNNFEEAKRYLTPSANLNNHAESYNLLGIILYFENDFKESLQSFSKAAINGSRDAKRTLSETLNPKNLLQLAKNSYKGSYDERMIRRANYYSLGAMQGDAECQYKLGRAYDFGDGVEEDIKLSIFWYEKAAEQGHIEAQCSMGFVYCTEVRDCITGYHWYVKAANQGHAGAQFQAGCLLLPPPLSVQIKYYKNHYANDPEKAVEWLRLSAAQGYDSAINMLGECYYNGRGVKKDTDKAKQLFRQAAAKGNERAKQNLEDAESCILF